MMRLRQCECGLRYTTKEIMTPEPLPKRHRPNRIRGKRAEAPRKPPPPPGKPKVRRPIKERSYARAWEPAPGADLHNIWKPNGHSDE